MDDFETARRALLLAPLIALIAEAMPAFASPLDPKQTVIVPPPQLVWKPNANYPAKSVDMCSLAGDINQPGLYYSLLRWWPGYMSAPHTYTTDRLCVVVSGTWWCNSGPDFDPAACVPVKPGSFVHRIATTPHYDGVIPGAPEPAVIAICGMGPVNYALVDPSKPGWRRV